MVSFPIVPLGDLVSQGNGSIAIGPFGSRMKADNYQSQGVPVVRGTNISAGKSLVGDWVFISQEFADGMPNCIARPGDLVLPHRGSIGEVAFIGPEHPQVVLSSSMMKFRPDPARADGEFVYYYLKSEAGRSEILRFSSQVGTPGIGQPLTSLRQVRVPVPPLNVQKAIAHTLSALDDKIELNRRMNETLEGMAQAIFRDWFVDFGPTRRKLAGVTNSVEIMGGLVQDRARAAELAALFPAAFGANGLPEGWEEGTLNDVSFLNSETWTAKTRPNRVEYVDLANTKWGTIEAVQVVANGEIPSRAQRILRSGDTIVGTVRPGNGSYAYVGRDGLTGSTGFAVLRPKRSELREFILIAATQRDNIDRLSHLADGGAYPAVRPEAVAATEVPIGPQPIMQSFHLMIGPIIELLEANKKENQTLAATRDLLLPKLMSGEIRLRDAEKLVEAAQ